MITNRDKAIANARALAQQIFAESYTPGRQAYYAERDGSISRDEYVGNHYERQSVYFGEDGHAVRLLNTGLGSVGYTGYETDYRNLLDPDAEATAILPAGKYGEDYLSRDDMPEALAARLDEGLYWDGAGWCPLAAEACHWTERDIDDPSDPLVEAIKSLPVGFFDDEAATEAA